MASRFTVELLAVGDELLYGDIVNNNAAWLGRQLAEIGVRVPTSVVVGDDTSAIAGAVTAALDRADAVVLTGGLGPTQDDLTREGLAAAAGVALRRDEFLADQLRRRFRALRRDVPERNYGQADLPEGAQPLPNDRGTAPGVRLEIRSGVAYALPGVPHEMEEMFRASVLPDLLRRAGEPAVVVHRVIRTAGMWESAVAEAHGARGGAVGPGRREPHRRLPGQWRADAAAHQCARRQQRRRCPAYRPRGDSSRAVRSAAPSTDSTTTAWRAWS